MTRGVVALCLVASLAACNAQRKRPPYASDDSDSRGGSKQDASAAIGPLPSGTETPCETVVELPLVKPNFYFVLDASGSMLEPMAGANNSRYRAAIDAIDDMLSGVQSRINFGAAVFPNSREGASCVAGNEVFALSEGSSTLSGGLTALEALVERLSGYIPEGGSPISSTLNSLYPKLTAMKGDTFVFLLSDGAPNCFAGTSCEASECILNLESARFDDGTVCDETLNCCAPDWFPYLCLDSKATLEELTRLSDSGVSTYVVGLPGGVAYAQLLNQMAIAGGTARGHSPPPKALLDAGSLTDASTAEAGFPREPEADTATSIPEEPSAQTDDGLLYYQVADAPSLALALATLSKEILVDCTLQLDFAPKNSNLLNVTAGDADLPADQWQLVSETRIELLGSACDQWKSGKLADVRVQEPCTAQAR